MSAKSRGGTTVVILVLLAAAIFWPLITGDKYLFMVWMLILCPPFFDSGSLLLMVVLFLVEMASIIAVTFSPTRGPIHPGAILIALLGVYVIGYLFAVMRN